MPGFILLLLDFLVMRRLYLASTFMICLIQAAQAQDQGRPSVSISTDIQHFDYREYSDQGILLDRETGWLPGLSLGLKYPKGSLTFSGQLSFHAGNVNYSGQTNSGSGISTTTQQRITHAELLVDYEFLNKQNGEMSFYAGAANHAWRRTIQPTTTSTGLPVRGLLEKYHWWQAFAGVTFTHRSTASLSWSADARLIRILSPKIIVDYAGLYDNAVLHPEERWGFRFSLPVTYAVRDSMNLVATPYLERYDLGRSPTAPLTWQGSTVGSVYEPQSRSSHAGITIGLHMLY